MPLKKTANLRESCQLGTKAAWAEAADLPVPLKREKLCEIWRSSCQKPWSFETMHPTCAETLEASETLLKLKAYGMGIGCFMIRHGHLSYANIGIQQDILPGW